MNHYECPHCHATVEYLTYSQECIEYGDYSLIENPENEDQAYDGDYNSNDSENSGNCDFTCPECDRAVCPTELLIISDDEDDEEEDEELSEEEREESSTIVIAPKSEEINWCDVPRSMICINKKCKHTILYELSDDGITCPKCGTDQEN